MQIRSQEIEEKRQIGTWKGKPVFQLALKGGFNLICCPTGTGIEYMGSGSHRSISKHVARKKYPDIKFTELNKSEEISLAGLEHQVNYWQSVTDQLNQASKK